MLETWEGGAQDIGLQRVTIVADNDEDGVGLRMPRCFAMRSPRIFL